MEAWIAFAGLLLLLIFSATQHKRTPPPRDVALEDEALCSHLQSIATAQKPRGRAKLHGARRSAHRLRRALTLLDMLRSDPPETAHELLPGAQWLADNARTLEDAALSLVRELFNAQPMPLCGNGPRVQMIARELISHTDAKLTVEAIHMAVDAWQSVQLLTIRELWALPLVLRATLVELLSHMALTCADAQRDRAAAEEWARQLAQADPSGLQQRFSRAPRSTCFFEHLLKCLRDQENAAALSWLDKQLDALDLRAQRVVEREHARQTVERQWIGNAITSLRALGQIQWNDLLEGLSSVESWLRDDPSGVYPRMGESSRAMYRARVERIARRASLSEVQVARNAQELAEIAQNSEPVLEFAQHVGYYLIDEGQDVLWRRMGGMPLAVSVRRFIARHIGPIYVVARAGGTIVLCLLGLFFGLTPALLLPAAFVASAGWAALLHVGLRRAAPPRILPRISYETLPEHCRTLVVVPTLLNQPQQARQMMRHLAVLQRANSDPNLEFMLLADFSDGPAAEQVNDIDITRAALEETRKLNAENPHTFFYLHRARVWSDAQGKFMGTERKRGALSALNGLILTGTSKDPFAAASIDPGFFYARYRQVITLDSDTLLPPGIALELVGMMTHPLNQPMRVDGRRRGRAVIQPRMEMTAHSVRTNIARIFGGAGGVDPYLTATSDIYQDVCGGRGSFAGKGIYDVAAFYEYTDELLRPNTILSHDLLEGELCGAALAADTPLYDNQPGSLRSWMMRLHRWTRGDWQLLPWLFPLIRTEHGRRKNPLDLLARYKIWDNMRRSLVPAMQVILLLLGVLLRSPIAVWSALLLPELGILLTPSRTALLAKGLELSLLPYRAYTLGDAAMRTIWRVFFSRQRLLEWVTAADAERQGNSGYRKLLWCSWAAAGCLVLFSFTRVWMLPLAILLGAVWCFAPQAARWLDASSLRVTVPSGEQREALTRLAQDTWKFFETTVTERDHWLPPDNLQLQPERGLAHRTSPTNIGLYLLSCVSAQRLGFIDADQMARRMSDTLDTIDRLEIWHGHLFNWYDTRTLAPLHPRYISAVDSGNLAGCVLTCAQAVREVYDQIDPTHRPLPKRLEALWESMDFSSVYDPQCDLFYIGVHPDTGRTGDSHYDLLASEARLLSFLAILRKAVPMRHWQRLGRSLLRTTKGAALASWCGTMFEYLMPVLIMRMTPETLLAETCREAALAHYDAGKRRNQPWGISESGYYAFDPMLNYQYRAFGLPQLALRSDACAQVIAPYASALALHALPEAACKNLLRMRDMDWSGELGFYEAADYTAPTPEAPYQLVRSHMAHHQGMALCALCNFLTADSLVQTFHSLPEVEAYALLLEERTPAQHRLHWPTRNNRRIDAPAKRPVRAIRHVQPETIPVETQLLYGEGTTLLCDARGSGYIAHNGLALTRWRPNPLASGYGLQCYLYDGEYNLAWRAAQSDLPGETRFETGSACYLRRQGNLHSQLQCFVDPLDGAVLHLLTLTNHAEKERSIHVSSFFEVALSPQSADVAHPAFRNLFVQTSRITHSAAIAQRRPRTPQESFPLLLHVAASEVPGLRWTVHTDRVRYLGRDHGFYLPQALRKRDAEDSVGAVIDPCMSLTTMLRVPAQGSVQLAFATMAVPNQEEAAALATRYADIGAARRSLELAQTQAQVAADYLSLDPSAQHQAQRLASYMLYYGQNTKREQNPEEKFTREELWACGLSGDLPILTLCIREPAHLALARAVFKIHEAWRQWGLWADLVLLDDHGGEYYPPTRNALQEMVAWGHARDLVGKPGGVHFLDAQVIQPARCAALHAYSALVLRGEDGPLGAQMKAMRLSILPVKAEWPEMARNDAPADLPAIKRLLFNGWGGFTREGHYVIDLAPDMPTPAPWCNILANPRFGTLLSERGAGFTFVHNSHSGRLTPWMNDPVRTRAGEAIYVRDEATGQFDSLLPHAQRITHAPGYSILEGSVWGIGYQITVFVDATETLKHTLVRLENLGHEVRTLSLTAFAAWVLGDHEGERRMVRTQVRQSVCTAQSPGMAGQAFLAMPGETVTQTCLDRAAFIGLGDAAQPRGMYLPALDSMGTDDPCAVLRAPIALAARGVAELHVVLGWAEHADGVQKLVHESSGQAQARLAAIHSLWDTRLSRIKIRTPDESFNALINTWLPYQLTVSRLWSRAGFYQAGGAYGFRDQLQDTLALLHTDPASVRAHLLVCAAHQFESGDVQHWWHSPARGVRTHMTDDLLFLPYVTAAYVHATGDRSVLHENIHYLQDVDIPAGQEDWYGNAEPSATCETLLQHGLRAIQRVTMGTHGLPLIGTGDWNDAMNRIGADGIGESVWLGWFFATVLREFAPLCTATQRDELLTLQTQVLNNLESHAWDGAWYRRAWFDDGSPLGTAGDSACEIDCIAQSWAVIAGARRERAEMAMDSLWEKLVDPEHRTLKLLTPPFDQYPRDPGYIQGYLPGIRENGGQYTHGAVWAVQAFAKLGQAERAWSLLRMLLPTSHSATKEDAQIYRVEPYVSVADVYANPQQLGRGGWTWYTGSAAWLWIAAMETLLGFEKIGTRLRLNALLPIEWVGFSCTYEYGNTTYRLTAHREASQVTLDDVRQADGWIELKDDGQLHEAMFPVRQ